MEFEVKIIESPSPEKLKEMRQFADANWGPHIDTAEEIANYFFDIPSYLVEARKENKLIGVVEIYLRKMMVAGRIISFGGIGGVVTHIDFRHQGVASKLMREAMTIMKRKNTDIAMLSTEIDKLGSFYGQFGFVPLNKPYYFLAKDQRKIEDRGGMIAPVSCADNFIWVLNTKEEIMAGKSNF